MVRRSKYIVWLMENEYDGFQRNPCSTWKEVQAFVANYIAQSRIKHIVQHNDGRITWGKEGLDHGELFITSGPLLEPLP